METGLTGFDEIEIPGAPDNAAIIKALAKQTPDRMRVIAQAMRHGLSDDEIHGVTMFDPWFLARIREIIEAEAACVKTACRHRRRAARSQDDGLHRRPACQSDRSQRGPSAPRAPATWASTPCSNASTPVLPNSRRRRPTCIPPTRPRLWARSNAKRALRSQKGCHSWRWSKPHRPRDRV